MTAYSVASQANVIHDVLVTSNQSNSSQQTAALKTV